MTRFSEGLKSIFLIMLIIFLSKPFYHAVKRLLQDTTELKTQVGVVHISGAILSSLKYCRYIKDLFEDDSIKAIVLRIDCPGGVAGSAQAIFEDIKSYKQAYNKPVITFVEKMCASSGYYIAAASDYIISTPAAFIGSIGLFIAYPELKEFINYYKINFNIIQTGEYKTIGNSLSSSLTPAQKAILQTITNDTYDQFVHDVSASRPQLAISQVRKWAEGKIFTGRQARELGLVDELGSYNKLIETVKKRAAIETEIDWVKRPKKSTVLSYIWDTIDPEDEEDEGSFIETCASIFTK